jgi:site-specific DNA-methyltransferase (adenine-specific)
MEAKKESLILELGDNPEKFHLICADSFEWIQNRAANSIHSVVTDPPYGLLEYRSDQLEKMKTGKGGVWRIPPALGGIQRRPLPRFTVLSDQERELLRQFFVRLAAGLIRILVPGGHVFIATNPLLSHLVYLPFIEAGFEKRGEIIRLVQTLRGGDRPKNAHLEYQEVSVMPRSQWEPWGLFRKPCENRVQDNLRRWGTGGLRRQPSGAPFGDVIVSAPTRGIERHICPHPSLKPQAFMRKIVFASLPLGQGIVLDPFVGGGSTLAAAVAVGYSSIGIEVNPEYVRIANQAIPKLSELNVDWQNGNGFRREI